MKMANEDFDFNSAGEQRSVIPAGTVCELQMTIRPGGAGEGGYLTQAKDGASEGLNVEYTVVNGEHAKRKFFERLTLKGTTPGHQDAQDISRRKLRAILESARGIKSNDKSEEAQAARRTEGWRSFDGLRFIARIGVQPPQNNYPAKNIINDVITAERREWHKVDQVVVAPNGSGAVAPASSQVPATPPTNAIIRPQWAS
jgi:hypothetical protein